MKKISFILLLTILFSFYFDSEIGLGQDYCQFTSIGGINFPNYDGFSHVDAVGYIRFICYTDKPGQGIIKVTITSSKGLYSNSYSMRYMKLSGLNEFLGYNLYIDPGRTQIWGDGTGGSYPIQIKVHPSRETSVTIYGRIPANQDPAAGVYADKVVATITP